MNTLMGMHMFPLQVDVTNFGMPTAKGDDVMYFVIGIAIIVIILVILNVVKGKFNKTGGAGGKHASATAPRNYSSFALHRLTADFGFTREQVQMLDYVLRSGAVSDPQRFLNSHDLIDRHFKRAYRLIERTSSDDEQLHERLATLFSVRNILEARAGNTKVAASTHNIPDKTAAVLTVGKASYPVQIVSSRGDTLQVEHPKRPTGGLLQLPKGSQATLAFFTKAAKGFVVETRIQGTTNTSTGQVLQLAHSGQIKKLSNRRFRRRQMIIEAGFFFVQIEGGKNKKMIVDKRRHTGTIIEISIGGCSMKSGTPVKHGQKLKVEFTREDDNSIVAALGEVLRTSRSGISTVIHIKFLKVPRRSLNSINAMVYEYTEK